MIIENSECRRYKLVSIIRPTLASDKVIQLMQSVVVVSADESIESQSINMQVLAYPIDRSKHGHLVVTELKVKPDTMKIMRRKMEIDENFLRIMFIKYEKSENAAESHLDFQVKDDFIKMISNYITKRGKISFTKVLKRKDRSAISQSIKRLRYLALLPFCNYDI